MSRNLPEPESGMAVFSAFRIWYEPCTPQSRMKIAIPQWQGRVSPVFDTAGSLLVVEVEGGHELRREERPLAQTDPLARAAEVSGLGARVLICGAVSAVLQARLASSGVRVMGFVCGAIDDVIGAYLNGELASPVFRMPGCRGYRRGISSGGNTMPRGVGMGSRGGAGQGAGGRGRMGGPRAAGPGGICVCAKCGEKTPHATGQPCAQIACPKCGTQMVRG